MENNTELKLPSNLLEELAMRKAAVKNAQDFIDVETEKYKNKIRDAEIFKEREEREIECIKNMNISITLESFVEEVAEEWNVDIKKLKVNVLFGTAEVLGKSSEKSFNKFCKTRKDLVMRLCVEYRGNMIQIANPLDLDSIHKGGKTLSDYLRVVHYEKCAFINTNFHCADYRNLIFTYNVSSLVDRKGKPYISTDELIFKAHARDNKKRNEANVNV